MVCADYFQGWQDIVEHMLVARNVAPGQAAELATMAVASIEGAILLCRANHTTEALERVGRQLRHFLEVTLAQN